MSKYFLQLFILLIFYISFAGFESNNRQEFLTENFFQVKETTPLFLTANDEWADSLLATLSLEERIAQMIMIPAYSNKDDNHIKEISNLIKRHHIGGIIFFQGGPERQVNMTNHFQKLSKIPLIIAMDAEWGLGMRLDSTISYPYQMSLGAIRNDELIYQMGYHIGNQLKRMGVHINFAPVADVNNNRFNPVINYRSFGEDRVNVALKAYNYARGLEDAGIIATLKHFPGHGDTDSDSHYTLPVINHTRERLDSIELYPFRYCIANGVPAVMTAHLNIPSIDSSAGLASSLSSKVVSDVLQNELNFKGLIISDALSMKGVSDYFKPGELEVQAVIAGNDILLMPSDVDKTITFIKREIKKGNISEDEINRRCKKILLAKSWTGLRKTPAQIKTESLIEELNSPFYKAFKRDLIRNSLTVIKNDHSKLPLKNYETLVIASLTIGNDETDIFASTLKLYHNTESLFISKSADYADFQLLKTKLSDYNTLIISIQNTSNRSSANFGISQQTIKFIQELDFPGITILCLFGNPYSIHLFNDLQSISNVLVAYEDNDEFKFLAAQGIFGAFEMSGRLPVSSNQIFTSGKSDLTPSLKVLAYGMPEEVLMNSEVLNKIYEVADEAIVKKATPGCQILVARYGKVVFHEALGNQLYDGKKKLDIFDLYDLASITKIAATLPLLMQLYEEGKFDLNEGIGKYLPEFDTTEKAHLTFANILTHQAGLQSWIPFYYSLLETMDTSFPLMSNRFSAEFPLKISNNLFVNKNVRLKENSYSYSLSPEFSLPTAQGIYLNKSYQDTVNQAIMNSLLNGNPRYLYSDLGNYLFHQIIENITGESLYPLLDGKFYSQLGTHTLGFLPLNRFPKEQIVPTENDLIFRKQLLQGYVHDPGAAMLGGISGHAGLFSNANDLAKMMQMYLNGGTYAGKRFISDSTLNKFTSCYFCNNGNRRGLGFDKPEPDPKKTSPSSKLASPSSYGHTGFTGTIAWMDPEYGLLYIFLSNRIHPDQYNQKLIELNIRTRIHDIIYESLLDVSLTRKK